MFGSSLALIVRAAALLAAAGVTGLGVLAFLAPRGAASRGQAAGVGLLLGWGAVGLALLGLALTGLYAPGPILGCTGLLAAAALPAATALLRRARESQTSWTGPGLVLLAASPVLAQLWTPVLEQDSHMHGLALPAQWLLAHRAVAAWLPLTMQLPSPLECAFALSLILGDERLAKVIGVSCAAAAWLAVSAAPPRPSARWLGPLLILALLPVLRFAATAKSDVAASALLAAGALLTRRGCGPPGWALLGLGAAAKFVYAPFVLVWIAVFPPRRGARWLAAGLLVAPSLPWWAKAWGLTGDPWYPFAAGVFPTFDWVRENRETFLAHQLPLWAADTLRWVRLPAGWWRLVRESDPWLLAAFPLALAVRRTRRAAVACLAGSLVLLRAGHLYRYALPAFWITAELAGEFLARRPGTARLAGALALARIGWLCAGPDPAPGVAGRAPAAVLREAGTTYLEAADRLRALGATRVLTVGEARIYRLPARVVFNGFSGETPVVWRLAKEAADEPRLSIRLRQANAPWLLYNLVTVDWVTPRYAAFAWDPRMLRLIANWSRRHLELVAPPDAFDSRSGGFALFRVHGRPRSPEPATVWFLPGAEVATLAARSAQDQGRYAEARAAWLPLCRAFPEVGAFHCALGYLEARHRHWSAALRELEPWVRAGMRDPRNLPAFGEAAIYAGRLDAAEAALAESIALYRGTVDQNRINLSWVWYLRASADWAAGRRRAADGWLGRAEAEIARVGVWADPAVEAPRLECLAAYAALRAKVTAAR